MSTLIQLVGNTNARLEETQSDVKELQSDVKEIKNGQERQDRILEMLSVNSIETDSYIQEL